jgi:hypothetical protein
MTSSLRDVTLVGAQRDRRAFGRPMRCHGNVVKHARRGNPYAAALRMTLRSYDSKPSSTRGKFMRSRRMQLVLFARDAVHRNVLRCHCGSADDVKNSSALARTLYPHLV